MSLIRLCYVSRATFKPYTVNGMDQQVAGILSQSRINNQRRNLVGALYYANGVFFQCLEGEESAIDQLLAQLQLDSRHTDLRVLSRLPIRERAFQDWEMKFAMLDREIRQFLREQQLPKFDPYKFTPAMTGELVKVLLAAQDVETEQLEAVVSHSHHPASSRFMQPVFMLVVGFLAGAGLMGLFSF
jgi:hypothetical protein